MFPLDKKYIGIPKASQSKTFQTFSCMSGGLKEIKYTMLFAKILNVFTSTKTKDPLKDILALYRLNYFINNKKNIVCIF